MACSHGVPTSAGEFRADALAKKVPRQAWQKLSAGTGAKGHRFHDWAVIDPADPHPGSRHLLIRRNRSAGELAYQAATRWPLPAPGLPLMRITIYGWSTKRLSPIHR